MNHTGRQGSTRVREGRLFIVSGPSGAGKGTLVRAVLGEVPKVWLSVSATTRSPRRGERPGVDYHFLGHEEFDALIASNSFLEWAEVHGNRYGTLRAPIAERLARGESVVLEIDPVGAAQVKAVIPESILVFIVPPDFDELRNRLNRRGSETPEEIERRLRTARRELEFACVYDYVIENADLKQATTELARILTERSRTRSAQDDSQSPRDEGLK